ncbi:hypothetical protein WA026_017043 [Henosepilachna vigintioctopunctata]
MNMKSSNITHKKTKNSSFYSSNPHKMKRSFVSMNNKLTDSNSSESVIYVGSYNMHEQFPIIDLTNSITSLDNDETATLVPKYPHLNNCHTVCNSIKNCCKDQNLSCTASTSRLLGSLEGPKSYLKRNSKSVSCIVGLNDSKHVDMFRTIDVSEESHSVTNKKRLYINQVTQLQKEDYDIIDSSLEIQGDINILEECNPQPIINTNDAVETLMQIYQVHGNDTFS